VCELYFKSKYFNIYKFHTLCFTVCSIVVTTVAMKAANKTGMLEVEMT